MRLRKDSIPQAAVDANMGVIHEYTGVRAENYIKLCSVNLPSRAMAMEESEPSSRLAAPGEELSASSRVLC